jgi:glycosyltransferase involved in cell wall biosynthesis
MKIALVSQPFDTVLPPSQNSVGLAMYEIGKRLAKTDDVVLYGGTYERESSVVHVDGMEVRLLPRRWEQRTKRVTRWIPEPKGRKRPQFSWDRTYLAYAVRIGLDLRRDGVDVVHINNFSQFAPTIRRLAGNPKIVLNMHCEWLNHLDPAVVGPRLRSVDCIMGCSDYIVDKACEAFPDFSGARTTAYPGIDTKDLRAIGETRPERPARRLLYVGRVTPEKGAHVLVEAMPAIEQHFPDVTLDIVGGFSQMTRRYLVDLSDDPLVSGLARFYDDEARDAYAGKLQARIDELGLADIVTLCGGLPYPDTVARFAEADILVHPALSEPFGRCIIEAMGSGIPAVATRIGGMQESIEHEKTGLLVAPDDPSEVAEAVMRIMRDDELRETLVRNGKQAVTERFEWDVIARVTRECYERLCASGK